MESSDINSDRWADDRLAGLDPPGDWRPNAGRALGQLRARDEGRRIRRGCWPWAAALAFVAVAAVVAVSLPWLRTLQRASKPTVTALGAEPVAAVIPVSPPTPMTPQATPATSAPKPAVAPRGMAPRAAEPAARNFKESGSPAAPITVEVYLDYECPPCAAFYGQVVPPLIAQYVRAGTVRLLHRDLPLPHHQYASVAARYTNAAGRAGYYEAAVEQIFKTLALWSRDGDIDAPLAQVLPAEAMRTVRELVNRDPGPGATAADDIAADIAADIAMARRDQINRTPALVIVSKGERTVLGPIVSFDALKRQLDELLARQGALPQPAAFNAGNPITLEDFKAGDTIRETRDRRATDTLQDLEGAAGDWAADVGAGAGYYAMRLSVLVGPDGKVFPKTSPMLHWRASNAESGFSICRMWKW